MVGICVTEKKKDKEMGGCDENYDDDDDDDDGEKMCQSEGEKKKHMRDSYEYEDDEYMKGRRMRGRDDYEMGGRDMGCQEDKYDDDDDTRDRRMRRGDDDDDDDDMMERRRDDWRGYWADE